MASQTSQLHFMMIPLMSPGHIIPMMDMAKLLAERGVTITMISTPRNAIRFTAALDRAKESGLPVQLVQVRFPSVEAGLPEGCESLDDVPSFELVRNFFIAVEMLEKPMEQLFEELEHPPNCIICDKALAWTAHISQKFKIPRIIFDGMSCFTQLCTHILHISKVHESFSKFEPFVVPGLPNQIELTRAQLPGAFNPGSMNIQDIRERIRKSESGAYGIVINSFEELERSYVDEFRKVQGGKVWCVGPLSLCNTDNFTKAHRGVKRASIGEQDCLDWLDSWPRGSVVYACLGSLSRVTPPQLIELALGLEGSNHPFICALRAGEKAKEIEEWIEEEGFEDRTKKRGLLVRGWAPQVLILSHPAIGGFLTHCGWNSTLEGVCAGVPMITWPLFGEQFLNEKLVVQVLEIGVSLGAQAVVHLGAEESAGVTVRREEIKKAVESIMGEGEGKGEERRERARQFGEMAKRAVEEGGSSQLNITLLIQDIMRVTSDKGDHQFELS